MKTSKSTHRGQTLAVLSILFATAALVACGGGGGSSPTPPPPSPPPAAATVTMTDQTAQGVVEQDNVVKFTVAGLTNTTSLEVGVVQNCGGAPVTMNTTVVPLTGGQGSSLPVAGKYAGLKVCSYSVNATAKNSAGAATVATVSGTFTPKAKYARVSYIILSQFGTIGTINADGSVTELVNKTGYTTGAAAPIFLCGIYDKLLTDGRPLATCVTPAAGNTRRNFPINPLTGELMEEYPGAVPVGSVGHDVPYGTFGDTPYAAYGVGNKGMYLDVPSVGTYFIKNDDTVRLRLTTDGFVTSRVTATCGSSIGCFQYLVSFSNP